MMTVRLRLATVLARWALTGRRKPLESVSRLSMRCWPSDLDVNLHMNNSRYLGLMDIGRYHLLLVTGLWRVVYKERLAPVLVGAEITFKRSIRPGETFVLETSLAESQEKASVLRQRFWVGDELAAEAKVTALFLKKGRAQVLGPVIERYPEVMATLAIAPASQGDLAQT